MMNCCRKMRLALVHSFIPFIISLPHRESRKILKISTRVGKKSVIKKRELKLHKPKDVSGKIFQLPRSTCSQSVHWEFRRRHLRRSVICSKATCDPSLARTVSEPKKKQHIGELINFNSARSTFVGTSRGVYFLWWDKNKQRTAESNATDVIKRAGKMS